MFGPTITGKWWYKAHNTLPKWAVLSFPVYKNRCCHRELAHSSCFCKQIWYQLQSNLNLSIQTILEIRIRRLHIWGILYRLFLVQLQQPCRTYELSLILRALCPDICPLQALPKGRRPEGKPEAGISQGIRAEGSGSIPVQLCLYSSSF